MLKVSKKVDINTKILEDIIKKKDDKGEINEINKKIDNMENKKDENLNINELKGIKNKIDNIESNFHIMCEEANRKSEEKNGKMEEKNLNIIKGLETQNEYLMTQNFKLKDRLPKINKDD